MKHLRSVRHIALRSVLKQARKDAGRVSQRRLAARLHRTQPGLAYIENGERRCDVLEFIDIGDALYEDRMKLFAELIRLSPRKHFPVKNTKGKTAQTKTKPARSSKAPVRGQQRGRRG